jgi:DNA-binding NarL/FixJ family response regulator
METSYHPETVAYLQSHITSRELEVIALMAMGLANKQIGARLQISAETVKKHVKNIFLKTGAHNRIEALNRTKWLTASQLPTETNCYTL